MKIEVFRWEKGWMWGCSKVQRLSKIIEVEIAIDIWWEYKYGGNTNAFR